MKPKLFGRIFVMAAACLLAWPIAAHADSSVSVQGVDTSRYPIVALKVSLPPSLSPEQEVRFKIDENGSDVGEVRSARVDSGPSASRVILVIDSSGSMKGKPLEDAKVAAERFVRSLGAGTEVAVVTFADKPRVAARFTSDASALGQAIGGVRASGETALYDALVEAARLASAGEPEARTSVVVLSDGGDTVSNTSLAKTRKTLQESGIPVYAVALKSAEYNSRPLEQITARTYGRMVSVKDSAQLAQLFEGIARELSSAWNVTYRSVRPRTADIEVDLVAEASGGSATVAFVYDNPAVRAASAAPITFPKVADNPGLLTVIALLALGAVALLISGVLLLAVRTQTGLSQLHYYDQLHEPEDLDLAPGSTSRVRGAIVDAVDAVAGRRGLTQLASKKLESAGLPLRASEYMTMHLLAVIGLGVATQLLTGNFVLALTVIVLTTLLPLIALERAAENRRRRFEDQLPDMLTMVAGSLRGGWGIQQAIGLAARETPSPMASELTRVETEARLGMPLERALQSMADRMGSSDFQAAVSAIAIQREVGGNLAEVLDLVAKTVRERQAMKRQVRALTSEGRLSAWILIALPFVIFVLLSLTSPLWLVPMLTSAMGLVMLGTGGLLLLIGTIWLFKVTNIEV